MLTFEFDPPVEHAPCACCGGRTFSLFRNVSSHGQAYAVYQAMFSDNHPEAYVSVLISFGDDSIPVIERCSFYVRIWTSGDSYQVGVCSAQESPWQNTESWGATLDREAALSHPLIKEVFHITDHIVAEDAPIIEYLWNESQKRT